ncbi:hypothetical protein EDB81DRAFT_777478 [Dactylonectria macrodidyma]|uniref:Uncharacterized protein n=1 Tax=Dactylonectria macrodidyma TaxID=307937 RepID=A0A9P9FQQ4_9HYPO|nr:hypothetical protein EDB81DRAFT_777478 [Dactylonectria macrodidyma]
MPVSTLLSMLPVTGCHACVIVINMIDYQRRFPTATRAELAFRVSLSFPEAFVAVANQISLFYNTIALSVLTRYTGIYDQQCPVVNCPNSRGEPVTECNHQNAQICFRIPRVYIKLDPVLGHSEPSWATVPTQARNMAHSSQEHVPDTSET